MKAIGITGQHGFVGQHLYNQISLQKDKYTLVPFERDAFADKAKLEAWVKQCDVIVHLAALNRHADSKVIHDTNIELNQLLADALVSSGHKPHVIFSSSTQEERDNDYGVSKQRGRKILEEWAAANNAVFTGLIIPNVFGAFGKPFYNSVVATFCHQLCNGLSPKIDVDSEVKLIYIGELVSLIMDAIDNNTNNASLVVLNTATIQVSQLLEQLNGYKRDYYDNGVFPELKDVFSRNLFNTFRSYIDHKSYFPYKLKKNVDDRGAFIELVRLGVGGQVSFSTTVPGITRGNHFHTRKIERFAVIKGKALIQLRKYNTDEVLNFELDGEEPAYVDMPIWYTHNIKNTGTEDLYTVFWINEFFDPADADTYFETV